MVPANVILLTAKLAKMLKNAMIFPIMWLRKLLESVIILSVIVIYIISCKVCGKQCVRSAMERFRFPWNNNKSCQRKSWERETVGPSILIGARVTPVWLMLMLLKLFLSIKLTHLLEEKNSGEIRSRPKHHMVWIWRKDFLCCPSVLCGKILSGCFCNVSRN